MRSGARSSSDRSGMRPGTGDGLAACTGGGLAACTSSTCSRNCLVSSCRFSLMKCILSDRSLLRALGSVT